MNDSIRIVSLGGLDEDGKNLICVEINNDIFVVECGVKEPDKTMPGVDYVVPRYEYLVENKNRIKGYFLLHGHNDEIGALAYIYPEAPAPVYGSKVTLEMLKLFTAHVKRDPKMYDLHQVLPTSTFTIAGREINYFHTAHNIADSSGIAINTSYGNIVITSDFVIENAATNNYLCDLNALARIAEKPTLALLTDSEYANRAGYTSPLYKLAPHVRDLFKNATGRIFASLYSTNLYNVDEIIQLAKMYRRKIVCYDPATLSLVQGMQSCGALMIPKENFASLDDVLRYRDQDLCILMCDFGPKLLRKIALLASGQNEDKRIRLKPTDSFILASLASDETEIEFTDAADELFRTGCNVTMIPKKSFLRMHASEEDLKMMASILKPKYYIPVKGFYKDLLANAQLALSMGINLGHNNVFLVENGVSVLIDEKGARTFDEHIIHGDLMKGGVGDVSQNVVDDRQKLSEGLVILAITISKTSRQIIAGPDVQMRGFVYGKDQDILQRDISRVFLNTVQEFLEKPIYNVLELKQNVYERCLRAVKKATQHQKDPMVVPLIVEID